MVVYKRDGMGFGDVKLFFAGGILAGFPGAIVVFLIAVVVATLFFAAIIITSKIAYGRKAEHIQTEMSEADEENTAVAENTDAPETEDGSDGSADTTAENEADSDEQTDDETVGFGSYLAFGPYLAAALAVYIVLFDLVKFLVQLYFNLFNF